MKNTKIIYWFKEILIRRNNAIEEDKMAKKGTLDTKQVIVIRKDLNMRKGKMCSQAAHASQLAFMKSSKIDGSNLIISLDNRNYSWLMNSFTKITVSVNSEKELIEIYNKAVEKNIYASLIKDNGKTEFKGVPTYTAVAIGPDFIDIIDELTGHLPLL